MSLLARIVGKDSEELEEFKCRICRDLLIHPMVVICCRQSYCKNCIDEWLSTRQHCPNDRNRLTSAELSEAPRLVVNLIGLLKFKCEVWEKGCPEVLSLAKIQEHLKTCNYNRCETCDYIGPDETHDCVVTLLQEREYLTDQISQLKGELEKKSTAIRSLEQANDQLIEQDKNYIELKSNLLNELAKLRHQAQENKVKIRVCVKNAIITAKGIPNLKVKCVNISKSWTKIKDEMHKIRFTLNNTVSAQVKKPSTQPSSQTSPPKPQNQMSTRIRSCSSLRSDLVNQYGQSGYRLPSVSHLNSKPSYAQVLALRTQTQQPG